MSTSLKETNDNFIHNMPDISLLVDIAEIFDVSIPEIINGERKSEIMEKEVKKQYYHYLIMRR